MNVERLHAVANSLRADFQKSNVIGIPNSLVNNLQNQINQPNQAQHQQNVSNELANLLSNLDQAASNQFSPEWLLPWVRSLEN